MSLITPNRRGGANKGGARRNENNRIYGLPLPLEFSTPATARFHPARHILGLFGIPDTRILNPHCEGTFDPLTCSVWVTNSKDSTILWRRGFFGKGDLSRSEPSWHTRQMTARKAAGKFLTSEEIREKRRAERKQFKLDRAAALAQAAAEAEAAFAEGREAAPVAIPSGATWKPQAHPTAEDSRSPTPALTEEVEQEPEEPLEDLEHLQLTLQEAFFLIWNFNCLTVIDPATNEPMSLQQIWSTFRSVYCDKLPPPLSEPAMKRFDNPFLVNYVAYHYFRSLGWVVKGGIKFCVDLLLYKRGPVFHHAEFAVLVMPVYEDPADQESSPFTLANAEPFSWSWLSTVNRVNSQVQKTLILAYVTIPASSRVSCDQTMSPACLAHYSIREVVLRRFLPARMRD
ncbi:hypothetical protein OBBRIDRAFT_552999 [Obba rivulosa]|uniref:tRNA-splicing endonuclease subunit Sen2 n=1 Tax=Obba rivulosa TaxID=1052685 RepID=A0A8E2AVB3_9APHY|nr:hypothetical protein OBBRIDRAFT_552999 [Obba rivulosa]